MYRASRKKKLKMKREDRRLSQFHIEQPATTTTTKKQIYPSRTCDVRTKNPHFIYFLMLFSSRMFFSRIRFKNKDRFSSRFALALENHPQLFFGCCFCCVPSLCYTRSHFLFDTFQYLLTHTIDTLTHHRSPSFYIFRVCVCFVCRARWCCQCPHTLPLNIFLFSLCVVDAYGGRAYFKKEKNFASPSNFHSCLLMSVWCSLLFFLSFSFFSFLQAKTVHELNQQQQQHQLRGKKGGQKRSTK